MTGRLIEITDTDKERIKINMLFTFSCFGSDYIVFSDPYREDGDLCCRAVEWGVWRGAYLTDEYIDSEALSVCNMILERYSMSPDAKMLCGEHYSVRRTMGADGKRVLRTARKKRLPILSGVFLCLPLLVKAAVAAILALAYTRLYINSSMSWATTVFPDMLRADLITLLYVIELVGAAALFAGKKDRTLWMLYLNALIPLNVVTMLGAMKVSSFLRYIVIAVMLTAAVTVVAKRLRTRKKAGWKDIRRAAMTLYPALLVCICVSVLSVYCFGVSGYTHKSSVLPSREYSEGDKAYISACEKLDESVWQELTVQERLDVLQTISNYECYVNLGCEPASVRAGYPDRVSVLGEHNSITDTIFINIEHLEDGPVYDVLDTLLHETRHAWQNAVIEMYTRVEGRLSEQDMQLELFRQAKQFLLNNDDYTSGSDDFDAYFGQPMEEDSRRWAEQRLLLEYHCYIYPDSSCRQNNHSHFRE